VTRRVLVAEDDADIRDTVADLLKDEGYEVSTAEDGRAALDALLSEAQLPGLILLDLMMPRMDGFQFRAEQQRDPRLAHIPVVLMSASGRLDEKVRALGALAALKKPFVDLEQIISTVSGAFDGADGGSIH
jgi:CheY-like chemotaxis protein